VIAVGNDRPLRKPLRQSQLFDSIVKAVLPSIRCRSYRP